jgi:hypothetical protein
MGVYPKGYDKEGFVEFLQKNHVKETVINKFKELPETLKKNNYIYKLNIVSTWFSIGETFYNFELNYYCEDQIEFLFSCKIFTNVEESINNLLCDLINGNYISKPEICK